MKIRPLILAAVLGAQACAPGANNDAVLQDTVNLMVAQGQHGEGLDIAEATAAIDEKIAAAPNDPYVLKVAAVARVGLADNATDAAERIKLREAALEQLNRSADMAGPNAAPRPVTMNGQPAEIDFKDVSELRSLMEGAIVNERQTQPPT